MQNYLKISLTVAVLFTSIFSFANATDYSIVVNQGSGKTISFTLEKANQVSILIYDSENEILSSEKIQGDKEVNKSYNLKDLPNGTYFFVAESSAKITKYKISVSESNVNVENAPISEIYKPQVSVDGKMINLEISHAKNDVKIELLDYNDVEYYSATKTATNGKLEMGFNTATSDNKQFIVKTSYNNNTFYNYVTIK